jgi:hypothetical protein
LFGLTNGEAKVKALKYVLAFVCIALGVALMFAAVQAMYNSFGLADNPANTIAAAFGAMFLLATFLLLRRDSNASQRPRDRR